jgi:hypothetical protein
MKERMRWLARALGWDRNPLRRPVDRIETVLTTMLLLAFLAGAPLLAIAAGSWAARVGAGAARAELAWREVPATVQRVVPESYAGYGAPGGVWAVARWTAPDGGQRSGEVALNQIVKRGESVRVWVNRAGQPVTAPVRPAEVRSWRILAEAATPFLLVLPLLLIGVAGRFLLDRRRMARWERTWRMLGPGWTRQH